MKIFHDNKINEAILTASSTEVSSEVDNLKSPQLSASFRFGLPDADLVIDLGQVETIKSFICDRGSLSDSGTYTLEANSVNEWITPPYSKTLKITESCIFLELNESYQYFRLKISDIEDVEIGYIVIGEEALQMPGIDPAVTLKYNTTSSSNFAVSGEVYGNEGYQYLSTTFNFNMIQESLAYIHGVQVATRKEILDVWQKIENINPVWVFLWSNNLDEFAPVFAVVNQKATSFVKQKYGKNYACSIAIRQVK